MIFSRLHLILSEAACLIRTEPEKYLTPSSLLTAIKKTRRSSFQSLMVLILARRSLWANIQTVLKYLLKKVTFLFIWVKFLVLETLKKYNHGRQTI
jgi:predicted patatin/cPLA2 family phospholipase